MHVSGQRPVILAVDDDDGIHETYRFIFEDQYEVLSATDGPHALKILQSSPVDLMLLDLKMPGMDGFAVLEHARRLRPDLPVVIVSVANTAHYGWSARRLGAVNYLTRPWDPDELEEAVRKALDGEVTRTIPAPPTPRVIVISADLGIRAGLMALLSLQCRVEGAANLTSAASAVRAHPPDLVIVELPSLADPDPPGVLDVRARVPDVPLLMIGSSVATDLKAAHRGITIALPAFDVERVLREAAALLATRPGLMKVNPPGPLVSRVVEHIITRFPKLTVAELARAVRVSPRHLYREFTAELSRLTPKDFLDRVRIEAAKCLLREGTAKIEAIAEQLDFCDAPHFSRVFREHTGLPPRLYRQI